MPNNELINLQANYSNKMELKLIFPQEFIDQIADRVIEKIKPLLSSNRKANIDDAIFDIKALCKYLSVSEQWVYNQVHLKEIPHLKIKGLLRFRKKDIDKWLNSFNTPAIGSSEQILKVIKGK